MKKSQRRSFFAASIAVLSMVGSNLTWFSGVESTQGQIVGKVLYELTPPANFSSNDPYVTFFASNNQVVGANYFIENYAAVLWNGSAASAVNLNPAGFFNSEVYCAGGGEQVGDGSTLGEPPYDALLWKGSAASAVNLNPAGFYSSSAIGTDGVQQVGDGEITQDSATDALLWSGSAASAVDLNPAGYGNSRAIGVSGGKQVGAAEINTSGDWHALLWSGTEASAVDLNPTWVAETEAVAVGGGEEVGYGGVNIIDPGHAIVWSGSAASAVDLNPAGFVGSEALGTNGSQQVGRGIPTDGDNDQAMLWSGSAASGIDLQNYLPAGPWTYSEADTIDSKGNIYGWADGTVNGTTYFYAVEWTEVPEPATFGLFAAAGAVLLSHRRIARAQKRRPKYSRHHHRSGRS
jgi:hypothetical protein